MPASSRLNIMKPSHALRATATATLAATTVLAYDMLDQLLAPKLAVVVAYDPPRTTSTPTSSAPAVSPFGGNLTIINPSTVPSPPTKTSSPATPTAEPPLSESASNLLVYSWTFPGMAPSYIIANETIAAADPCPALIPAIDRSQLGLRGSVGVFTHPSGRGVGFQLDGTDQHGEMCHVLEEIFG